ncbi:MAG: glycosyltransferase family 39 protein [Methylotenera sp.]|nr:glycosyltransferase family 39 protein [Methylotenera sp.]
MNTSKTNKYKRLLFATFVIGVLILFWGLGSVSLTSLNEGRRALAIKEMFESGNWLLPTLNGELYLTKPPLLYWISLCFSGLVGVVNEWTLRLPSAFAALTTLWMVYRYTLKKFGEWPALFSVQILMANLGFAMLARRVEIEMLLTALCVGALLSALKYLEAPARRIWIYLSYFLLALAVLTKGPVALLFVTLPLIVAAIWTKDPSIKQILTSFKGWVIFFIVALSWYLIISLQLGFDIWSMIAKRDMLGKIQADEVAKPILSYFGWIIVDFLFLAGLLLVRSKSLFKSLMGRRDWMVLLMAIAVPLLVFSFFSNKHTKYLLPIYPFISIVLGVQLARLFDISANKYKRLILTLGILLPLILACFYMFAEKHIFSYRTSAFSQFQDWEKTIAPNKLFAFGKTDNRIIYYATTPIKNLETGELKVFIDDNKSFLLIAENDDASKLQTFAGCKIKEFKPYLKMKKSLVVFGFGDVCYKVYK